VLEIISRIHDDGQVVRRQQAAAIGEFAPLPASDHTRKDNPFNSLRDSSGLIL
jgi:hypothetical protein